MVMISRTRPHDSLVIVTTLTDSKKRPVIASVMVNGRGYFNSVEVDANIMTSAYGREGFKKFLTDAFTEDRILSVDKERSHRLRTIPGVQFPNNIPIGDSSDNIARFRDTVNTSIRENGAEYDKKMEQEKNNHRYQLKDVGEVDYDKLTAVFVSFTLNESDKKYTPTHNAAKDRQI